MENKLQKIKKSIYYKIWSESKLDILVEEQTNNSKELQAIRNDFRKFYQISLRNKKF